MVPQAKHRIVDYPEYHLSSGAVLCSFRLSCCFSLPSGIRSSWSHLFVLGMHILDIYIIVLPFVHPTGVQVSVFDILCLFAIGCPLAFLFLRRLGSAPLFPSRDPHSSSQSI